MSTPLWRHPTSLVDFLQLHKRNAKRSELSPLAASPADSVLRCTSYLTSHKSRHLPTMTCTGHTGISSILVAQVLLDRSLVLFEPPAQWCKPRTRSQSSTCATCAMGDARELVMSEDGQQRTYEYGDRLRSALENARRFACRGTSFALTPPQGRAGTIQRAGKRILVSYV